jgi:hypothetical protein
MGHLRTVSLKKITELRYTLQMRKSLAFTSLCCGWEHVVPKAAERRLPTTLYYHLVKKKTMTDANVNVIDDREEWPLLPGVYKAFLMQTNEGGHYGRDWAQSS